MSQKDEIRILNSRIDSLNYQIKQMNDFKEENKRIKEGLKKSIDEIYQINKEKDKIEQSVSEVFNSFKQLIKKKGSDFSKLKSSYNRDLIERMKKDNKYFELKLNSIDKKSKNLLDDLYSKVKQYCSGLSSGSGSQDNLMVDINAIKYNLENILNEFNFIFKEIEKILSLSSQYIEEEDEETVRTLKMMEVMVNEIDRIIPFVPANQLVRNDSLVQLGLDANNYPRNTPTIRIILLEMQEIKRKRQTQLRSILDEIKFKSKNILTKKADLENEINNALNLIDPNRKKNENQNNGEIFDLETLFLNANKQNLNNIREFRNEVVGELEKEIEDLTKKIEQEGKDAEDVLKKIKEEFKKQWGKLRAEGCESIFSHIKSGSSIHFEKHLEKYQQYNDITDVIKDKVFSPDCIIIKQGLLNCDKTIEEIKKDINPVKCTILLQNSKNDYINELHEFLVKSLPFQNYYEENMSLSSFSYNVEYNIKKITAIQIYDVIFPILVLHFKDYDEFEKEISTYERLLVNCIKSKVGFIFYFNIGKDKEIASINKKLNTFIEKSDLIQSVLKESQYPISQNLACNKKGIEFCGKETMEKLTNFKKDIKYNINEYELKNEYFDKMFQVYNTHHISNDLDSIRNGPDEVQCRHRALDSIMNYSLLSLNLDKKPKTRQLKEREEITLNEKVGAILDSIYNNKISKDFEEYLEELISRKSFELYLKRERVMADFDTQYDTSLLTDEDDGEKTKKMIYKEIEDLIEKKYKKDSLKIIGRIIWSSFFERYCPKFYLLMQNGFKVPDDFCQFLVDSLNN
jgi:predicted secreted protein